MSSNGGNPQPETASDPTPPHTNVGGESVGVKAGSTTAQVDTATPSSNQLP